MPWESKGGNGWAEPGPSRGTGFHVCTGAGLCPLPLPSLPWPAFKCWLLGLPRPFLTNPYSGAEERAEASGLVLLGPSSVTLGKSLPLPPCLMRLLGRFYGNESLAWPRAVLRAS